VYCRPPWPLPRCCEHPDPLPGGCPPARYRRSEAMSPFFNMPLDFQHLEALGTDQGRVQNVQPVGGQHGEHFVQRRFTIDEIQELVGQFVRRVPAGTAALGARASPSSKKTTVGAIILAMSYTFSRLSTAPSTGLDGSCRALALVAISWTSVFSLSQVRARKVLPLPGGPLSTTPFSSPHYNTGNCWSSPKRCP
jgi:hypothetical protein